MYPLLKKNLISAVNEHKIYGMQFRYMSLHLVIDYFLECVPIFIEFLALASKIELNITVE